MGSAPLPACLLALSLAGTVLAPGKHWAQGRRDRGWQCQPGGDIAHRAPTDHPE